MSLILEALKKIESDKSRKMQKTDIASAILQPDTRENRRKVLLISGLLFTAAVLLFAAGAGISYLLTTKEQPLKASVTAQPNLHPKADVSSPFRAGAITKPERQAEVSLELVKPMHSEARQPVVRKSPPPSAPKQRRSAPIKVSEPEENPQVNVSGIIWAEESGARRALVNGASVKEGDTVEGALIERIEPHHIRISKDGKPFDIPIR
jgi:hypothetical protein